MMPAGLARWWDHFVREDDAILLEGHIYPACSIRKRPLCFGEDESAAVKLLRLRLKVLNAAHAVIVLVGKKEGVGGEVENGRAFLQAAQVLLAGIDEFGSPG